jgi:hypothetical protein
MGRAGLAGQVGCRLSAKTYARQAPPDLTAICQNGHVRGKTSGAVFASPRASGETLTITNIRIRLFAVALTLWAVTAQATCGQAGLGDVALYRHPSISVEFQEARFVLLGRVTHQRNIASAEDPDGYDWTIYDVEVLQAFKGGPPRLIQLQSENSSARFPMDQGKTYLLFVTRLPMVEHEGDETLPQDYVDNCGNSAVLDAADGKVRAVERLSLQR